MMAYEVSPAEWFPAPMIRVVLGSERCYKLMEKMGYDDAPSDKTAAAWTSYKQGDDTIVVCLADGFKKAERKHQEAMIAHEAMHCALRWCAFIGEEDPAEEELAYMVQCSYLSIREGWKAEQKKGR